MKIKKLKNKIVIENPVDFNAKQIVTCGQIFRYNINENKVTIFTKNKKCEVVTNKNKVEILCKDVDYFFNFFDLNTNYSLIKNQLKKDKFLSPAIDYGYGIRILKNDLFEIIVSFIISANNNISRIKNSIEILCKNFGSDMGDFFAFPTLLQLKNATINDFKLAGLGYRAGQLYSTIQNLKDSDIQTLKTMPKSEQEKFLLTLKGVGEKVKNCIMLFALNSTNSFPVDTWINKAYNNLTNTTNKNRLQITKELEEKYKNLSGYAQQYFFYYYRENKIK